MSRRIAKGQRPAQRPAPWAVLVIAGGLLLLGLAAYLLKGNSAAGPAAAVEVTGAPRLKIDPDLIDLGDVTLGQTVEARFQLTNVGDQPLKFSAPPYVEIVEGCWPPEPTIGSMVLQPGQSTTLAMSFRMHGDMGGRHNFLVHLPNNDAQNSPQTATVLSNWVP